MQPDLIQTLIDRFFKYKPNAATINNAITVFLEMASFDPKMPLRNENDKEYFAQDWFQRVLDSSGLSNQPQGRNSYPDFHVDERDGYEVKSLSIKNGRPSRKDIDFNSHPPGALYKDKDMFFVFIFYIKKDGYSVVDTLSLVHGSFINDKKFNYENDKILGIGSYNDGYVCISSSIVY